MNSKRKRRERAPGKTPQQIDDKASGKTTTPPQALVPEDLPKQERVEHENDFA